jgi:hypothetical protein
MEAWVVTVLLELLVPESDLGAALAGAANPATARTPVSKNVAAIFFIRWSFQSIRFDHALRASLYGRNINKKAM